MLMFSERIAEKFKLYVSSSPLTNTFQFRKIPQTYFVCLVHSLKMQNKFFNNGINNYAQSTRHSKKLLVIQVKCCVVFCVLSDCRSS